MADISKIKALNGTTYNLKDATARNDKVSKSGDTMAGALAVQDNSIRLVDASGNRLSEYGYSTNYNRAIIFQRNASNPSYYEQYVFPNADSDLTANATYGILTTKDIVISTNTADSISLSSDTLTNIASLALERGTYIIQFTAYFTVNTNGYREILLSSSPTGEAAMDRFSCIRHAPASGVQTALSSVAFNKFNSAITLYVKARQTSGTALTCSGGIRAIKIAVQ